MTLQASDQAGSLRAARGAAGRPLWLRRSGVRAPRSIAITSGKGGVGKTQIAANLAVSLAHQGRRVLLLDADLGLASLDLALGVKPTHDLRAVLEGRQPIEEVLVQGPEGVRLLPACPGRYEMANLSPLERDRLANAIDEVAAHFDVLVIDTGAGIGSTSVAFASSADDVLLVATPDPTAVRDAYAMAKVLNRRSAIERVHLIANQVASEAEGVELHDRLLGIVRRFLTLDLRYLGCVPRDEAVRRATAAGEPFVLRSPTSLAARATEGLVRRLGTCPSSSETC